METRTKIELATETARACQIADDICSRSVLLGIATFSDEISDEMITASLSLAGGTGGASGSCGAYCAGLLAVGAHFNAQVGDERENPALKLAAVNKFSEYRDKFLAKYGTVMCPQLQKQLFGRSYIFTDPVQNEEFLTLEGHNIKCAEIVAEAARLAAEMILE